MRDALFLLGHTAQINRPRQWYESDEGDARLSHDRKLVAARFPTLQFGLNYRSKLVFLEGILTLWAECGVPTDILVRMLFPPDYPKKEPVTIDKSGLFPHEADRHFASDMCCLWLPPESEWKAEESNALYDFLCHVSVFFERQLMYDADPEKKWPWGERAHNVKGYIEYMAEQLGGSRLLQVFAPYVIGGLQLAPGDKCPCQSGRRFKVCHLRRIEKLSRTLGGGTLAEVMQQSTVQEGVGIAA